MKPTPAQLNLAAIIYGTALLALTDAGSGRAVFGTKVRRKMASRARQQLARLGIHPGDIQNEDDAVRAAIALKPA